MKKILFSMCILASAYTFAGSQVVEFDEAKEIKCYNEIKTLGCLNAKGEENSDCVEAKKAKLTAECKNIHEVKRQNR